MIEVSIYTLSDPRSNEIRYVGLTRNVAKRLGRYVRPHTKHLNNWFESVKASGDFPALTVIEVVPEPESGECERKWIKHFRELGCNLLNYTDGGERSYTITEEYRRNLSSARKGKGLGPMSQAHKDSISAGNRGKKKPDGFGKRFSALNKSRIGTPLSDEHKRRVSDGVKKAMTPEVRKKISDKLIGIVRPSRSAENRAKTSESMKVWHLQNKKTFTETMRRRGSVVTNDPVSGRFIPKPRTTVIESK